MVTTSMTGRNGTDRRSGSGNARGALGALSFVRDEKAFAAALVNFCRWSGPEAPGWLVRAIGAGRAPSA